MSLPPEGGIGGGTSAEEAAAARLDNYLLSPKFHGRVRAATLALMAATAVACATADWESFYGGGGRRTIFSDVRPAMRRALDRMYGVADSGGEGSAGQAKEGRQNQQQKQREAAAAPTTQRR